MVLVQLVKIGIFVIEDRLVQVCFDNISFKHKKSLIVVISSSILKRKRVRVWSWRAFCFTGANDETGVRRSLILLPWTCCKNSSRVKLASQVCPVRGKQSIACANICSSQFGNGRSAKKTGMDLQIALAKWMEWTLNGWVGSLLGFLPSGFHEVYNGFCDFFVAPELWI